MKRHHYTTIETLALILDSKKIRFNRLTNVDDVQESKNFGEYDLSKFIYISCWTTNDEESIPLWKMYTSDMKGVRISFDGDPFHVQAPDPSDVPNLDMRIEEGVLSPVPFSQIMSDQYFIMPSFLTKGHFGKKVEYVDDVAGIYSDSVKLNIDDSGKAHMKVAGSGELAIHKSKIWSFQEEYRYTLVAFPPPQGGYSTKNFAEVSNTAINSVYHGIGPETEFIDLDICPNKYANLVVTLGPLCSYGDELLVKALLDKYSPKSSLRSSKLNGQIRQRT